MLACRGNLELWFYCTLFEARWIGCSVVTILPDPTTHKVAQVCFSDLTGWVQLPAARAAEGSRKCEGVGKTQLKTFTIYIISFCSSISHHGRPLLAGKHMENVVAVVCHRIWRTYHSFSQSCSYSWTKSSTRVVRWRTCTARAARAATAFDKMCQALLNFVLDLHSSALIKHHWSSLVDIGCVLFCSFLGSKDWGILGAL